MQTLKFLPQAMRANIVHDIEKVEGQLDAEAKEDEEARQHYGEREWPLQPASVCTANLRDRVAGYKWAVLPASCQSLTCVPSARKWDITAAASKQKAAAAW
jgi:ALIX V-shaped domain binding to HIV